MAYIKSKHFKQLKGIPLKITAIYPAYRSGWIKTADGKFIWRTFKYQDWKLLEQKWDDVNRKFSLVPFVDIKQDRDFFKTYKKVFDVTFETEQEQTIKDEKKWEIVDYSFTLQWLSAYKLQEIMRATKIEDVPVDENGKEQFDWEDEFLKDMEWVFFKFNVTWTWLDTKYTFKEVKPFGGIKEITKDEISIEDCPF